MKKNWMPHVITAVSLAVFIVLGLACMTVGPDSGPQLATPSNTKSDQNAQAAYERGRAAHEAGDYDLAIREYTEAIWLNPSRNSANAALIYYCRGHAYGSKGDFDHAIADLEESLRINPDNADVRELLEIARRAQQNSQWEQDNSWTLTPQ